MSKKLLPVLLCTFALAGAAQHNTHTTAALPTSGSNNTTATQKLDRTLRNVQRQHNNFLQQQANARRINVNASTAQHDTRTSLAADTTSIALSLTAADSLSAPSVNYNGTRQSILAPFSIFITTQPNASDDVALMLQQAGQHAQRISETVVTARVNAEWLQQLSADKRVVRLTASKRLRPFLQRARAATGVDRVHAGEGLTTPFTGKGVLVAVIDQSFEFKHMGFLDAEGKSRVKALWDRTRNPNTDRPSGEGPIFNVDNASRTHDLYDSGSGHATHVTNIAAGSRHTGNSYYGVATEADILMIPSSFDGNEITEDVAYIKRYAEQQKQPWVVNMSFGSIIGPHDGSTEYDQTIEKLVNGKGGIAVAASGNEGGSTIHAVSTFQPGQTKQLFIDFQEGENPTDEDYLYVDFWGDKTVSSEQFEIRPILAIPTTNGTYRIDRRNSRFWSQYIDEYSTQDRAIYSEIDKNNQRENHYLAIQWNKLVANLGTNAQGAKLGVEIQARSTNTGAANLHAWTDGGENNSEFTEITTNSTTPTITPDNLYIIGEGAASIPSAIAVGSYTSAVPSGFGSDEQTGTRSSFSSNGPWLNTNYVKPAVLAPGSLIMSALNQHASDFKTSEARRASFRNSNYYYGYMQGTSMASPFVAGTVALWLQAYPELKSEDVMEILRKTSTKLSPMGGASWTPTYGYGLINAYEGLKEALAMAKTAGLSRVSSSTAPASFNILPSQWQVLFNNPERSATIEVLSLDGRSIWQRTLHNVQQSDEVNIAAPDFAPGVYVLQVSTPGAKVSHKVVRQ